jgi:hypothetical protein
LVDTSGHSSMQGNITDIETGVKIQPKELGLVETSGRSSLLELSSNRFFFSKNRIIFIWKNMNKLCGKNSDEIPAINDTV